MMLKLTPEAVLMTVRCKEGWQVEAVKLGGGTVKLGCLALLKLAAVTTGEGPSRLSRSRDDQAYYFK